MKTKQVVFLQGNEACAYGAIAAGANFFAGYPITPATEIAEVLSGLMPQTGGVFVQMEDELGCMGALCGASMAGAKALTATSGPGFTLLQENIGYACINELPCVIFDVQRGGPSTGLPTLTSQGDVMQAKWGTHGDHPIIVLAPSSVSECYSLTIEAFNLAEKYRTPVIMLSDAIIGHMRERVEIPAQEDISVYNRIQPKPGLTSYRPYDASGSAVWGVAAMANLGNGYRHYISGGIHDETGASKMNSPEVARQLLTRLLDKIEHNRDDIVHYEAQYTNQAEVLVFAYGSVARPSLEAVKQAQKAGLRAGYFRAITLWPSPSKELLSNLQSVHTIIIPEMNGSQYAGEVASIVGTAGKRVKLVKMPELGSTTLRPEKILKAIKEACK